MRITIDSTTISLHRRVDETWDIYTSLKMDDYENTQEGSQAFSGDMTKARGVWDEANRDFASWIGLEVRIALRVAEKLEADANAT